MSRTIDEKVVSMQFDNRQFERNISTSMSTLDKLRQSLNLTGAAKGLDDVREAAGKLDFSGMTRGIETVQTRFSYMQATIQHQINNLVDSVINAGKRMASALTLDPIKTGFAEYETQINAVQTILANTESKGTTLQDVNSALDTLNTYADKTIYNFTEMTRNIGTFTAAGVDLKTSVSAIQGIANLAAVSGSTSQQASTAMYQLSQALSSGTVKLMDWNSVVNAGMGGQVFQDALKQTARVHGVAIDDMIKKNGSFRETLQEGWLTSDILTETLMQFTMAAQEGSAEWQNYKKSLMDTGYSEAQAESILKMANTATDAATKVKTFTQLWDTLKESAQSGWTQTWEIIVGDFGEAKTLLTEISNTIGEMIGASAEARNELLNSGLASGWKQLLGAGIADEASYTDTFKQVAKDRGVAIDEMIKAEKDLDASLSDTEAFQKALKKGLTEGKLTTDMFSDSVHKMSDKMSSMSAKELEAAGYTAAHVNEIKKLSDGLKDGSISMDEFVAKMERPSGRENIIDALWNSFNAVMSVIKPVKQAFRDIFKPLSSEQLYSFTEALKVFTSKLTLSDSASDKLRRTFAGLFAIVDIIKQALVAVVKAIAPLFSGFDKLGGGILDVTADLGDWFVALNESVRKGAVFEKAINKIKVVLQKLKEFLTPIAEGMKQFGASIADSMGAIADKVKIRFEPLTLLGEFIRDVFIGLGKIIGKVSPFVMSAAIGIGNVFSELMNKISSSIQSANFSTLFDFINGGVFTAIGVFIAKFIKSGGDLLDNASGFLEGITGILDGVGDALGAFTDSIKADTLKKIATAIGILAASLFVLSIIDSVQLTASLAAISTLFVELIATLSVLSKIDTGKGMASITAALIGISTGLLILSVALAILSTMSLGEMGVALISMTAGLGALVGAINLLPDGNVKKAASALKTLSVSLVIFAVAMKILGSLSWSEMGVGLVSVVVGLGALVGAIKLLPQDTALRAAGMLGLATAMLILGAALKIMASMTWEEMAKSLVTLGASLLILAGAMYLMTAGVAGAFAMLIIAPALVIMAAALKTMGSLSWEEIARSLVVLAGALLIIAGAMYLMTSGIAGAAAMVVMAGALAVLAPVLKLLGSLSWEEIGKGLLALAGAFAIIGLAAYLLTPIVPVILALAGAIALLGIGLAAIGAGIFLFATGMAALTLAFSTGGTAVILYVSALIGLIPYVIQQIGIGLMLLCEVIAGSAAAICAAVSVIIVAIINALVEAIPPLLLGLGVLLTALMAYLLEYIPKVVEFMLTLLAAVYNAIAEHFGEFIEAGANLLTAFIRGIAKTVPKLVSEIYRAMVDMINGMAEAIRSNAADLIAAVDNLMFAILDAIIAWYASLKDKGFQIVDHIITGITGKESNIKKTIGDLMKKAKDVIGEKLSEWKEAGKNIIGGFIEGVKSKATSLVNAAKNVVSDALEGAKKLLGIHSPSKEFAKLGRYSDEGMIMGLEQYAGKVKDAAEDVGGKALDGMSSAMAKVQDLFNSDMDAQPTIRPILDLSEVSAGAGAINGMFNDSTLGVLSNVRVIGSMMNNRQNGNEDVVSAINKLNKALNNLPTGNVTNINGLTYDDGSNINNAVQTLVRAVVMEGRA